MRPLPLPPNLVERPYRGGSRLAAFRGISIGDRDRVPEDWVGSTTGAFQRGDLGLTHLPDGSTLVTAIAGDPAGYLGPAHTAVFGADTGLLVKLIDAQQRLSVHLHPDRAFARRHLDLTYGKTEAWYILDARKGAQVHLGFRDPVGRDELLSVVVSGAGASLLERLNRVPVGAGDVILVPAGVPHAIGEGIFLVEVQEPSDLLVRLEWQGYVVGAMPNDLGLGFEVALEGVDRSGWDDFRLASLVRPARGPGPLDGLLPPAAAPFFRLDRLGDGANLDAGFSILIVTRGSGELRGTDGLVVILERGAAWLVPWAMGRASVAGDVEIIRCRPADPSVVATADPELVGRLARATSVHAVG